MYCLDAGTGVLCWRYHVAPNERRISVYGKLGSAWPVQSILLQNGAIFATAGILSALDDGSAMVACDAITGKNLWTKTYKDSGATSTTTGRLKRETPNAGGGGQLAWYDGKIWWMAGEYGPCVVDPANGNLSRAVDDALLGIQPDDRYASQLEWYRCPGPDIGILPGGWIAIGKIRFLSMYSMGHLLLRSGPDGVPVGDKNTPQMVRLARSSEAGFTTSEIPVWDDRSVLVNGEDKITPPMLYPATGATGFPTALNAVGDAVRISATDTKKKGLLDRVQVVSGTLANCPGQQAVSPELWNGMKSNIRTHTLYGSPVLAGNAVLWTVFTPIMGTTQAIYKARMSPLATANWRVIAVNRDDQTLLFTVYLPGTPAPSGMSLTRNGDVIVPLVDGRVVCIGGTVAQPLPAANAQGTVAGLRMDTFPSDYRNGYFGAWEEANMAGMTPIDTSTSSLKYSDNKIDTLVWLHGYVNIPTTGTYTFSGRCSQNSLGIFQLLDATKTYIVSRSVMSQWGGSSQPLYLAQGLHPIAALVVYGKSGKSLNIQWEGPGIPRGDIPESALSHLPTPK